jgi:O-antigen ligase
MNVILKKSHLNQFLLTVLALLPMGLFTVRGWAGGVLYLSCMLSIVLILRESRNNLQALPNGLWPKLIMMMLASPLVAVMLSSALRGEWIWANFDSFSRFFIAAPIFFALYQNRILVIKQWQYFIPLGLIATLFGAMFLPGYYGDSNSFDSGRLAIYFTDPLTLGYLSLTLGALSLFSINIFSKDSWWVVLLKIIGGLIGFYISLRTQSRTGWLAIPLILILLMLLYGPKNKLLSLLFGLVVTIVVLGTAYMASSTVQQRMHQAIIDIHDYKFDEPNPETSLGERISFVRIGYHYFKLSPIYGWGLNGFRAHSNDPEIVRFASESTRATSALFHSEIVTNAVVHGVIGLTSILGIFILPVVLCIRQWLRGVNPKLCAFGLVYLLCEFVSSLSTEIFSLKFAVSFHAIFVACLAAQLLSEDPSINSENLIIS